MTLNAGNPAGGAAPVHNADAVYALTAGAEPAGERLDGDLRVDVAVVGGGITGLSSAYHLAKAGVRVALVEAHGFGWGASGRNGGQVNPGLKHEPAEIERTFGPELGARMVAFAFTAPDKVFQLVSEAGIACEARRTGTLRAAFSAGSVAFLERATAELQRRGMPVEWLDREAVAQATGTTRYTAAALDRRGGALNPLAYSRGLARAAAGAGARLFSHTPALSLARISDGWMLATPTGQIRAARVILGTNGYTDDLWPGLKRAVVPVFSGIIASEPLAEREAARILPGRHVLYEHESITVYYRLDAANRLLMGGRSRLQPLHGPAPFADLQRYTRRLWPFLADIRWSHGWNGQLGITMDHYPVIAAPAPGLVACIGYNGRGVAMATAMGGELARWATGTPEHALDMPVRPFTTYPFHRFWPIGAAIRIGYGRARNALGI
ncbi:glycine/D-amino acid oxidase-like deaminating enzyme [Angulomicrobium tetraedrale]|uniref:Glycine/D-amino acid oxidase-like deaminating enzyme n=1 Tax=Ancylobacter tetraedralis TaxID=217068 RepID=A0A839ZD90_9HYPH|nr:FAD-binding oxidoreductase [Ancylobacter tetraedralis]MBB3772678.1 glycine/D-amino acid oxidase-like deaminating enzyme [Ancylobacter tetraedralis]